MTRFTNLLIIIVISESGVVRLREPFKFWWPPAISVEWLKLQWSHFVHQ